MMQFSSKYSRLVTSCLKHRFISSTYPSKGTIPTKKSWVPTDDTKLQEITTQALILDVSMQQFQSAAVIVPWFLKNMPVSLNVFLKLNYHSLFQILGIILSTNRSRNKKTAS
jgi:hypothetical protein